MRKVFLDHLPRWEVVGRHKGKINWLKSIGYKVRFIYYDIEGWIEIIKYVQEEQRLKIKYNDNEFEIKTSGFIGCKLGRIIGKHTTEFKIELGQNFQDKKRDITITDRKIEKRKHGKSIVNEKLYKYYCNKCGFDCNKHYSTKYKKYIEEFWIPESNLLYKKNGCACCCSTPLAIVEGINTIWDTDKWMIPYVGEEVAKTHTNCSHDKIYPICPDCGKTKSKKIPISDIYLHHSIGCSCGDGIKYPNKLALNILEQLNVDCETEYSPDWISPKRYDFYFKLNSKEYILEMDGYFHKNDNLMNNQTKEESKDIDSKKDELAIKHGIEVIRIDCENSELEYIKKNIINSKLNEIFSLSQIDWMRCDEFAMSNLVKIACRYKRNNTNLSVGDIMRIMGFARTTIIKWLRKGNKHGWCEYNPKEEMGKKSCDINKLKRKPVEIFKDNVSLGVFESITELERQSEELFGIKLNHSNICKVCKGEASQYKGFTFKYV